MVYLMKGIFKFFSVYFWIHNTLTANWQDPLNLGIPDINSFRYYVTVFKRRLKLPCSLTMCHSRGLRKCYVRTSVNLKVNVLDDFATHCVGNSSVVMIVAVSLQIVGYFILLAPGVVVAIALVAADCQTCNTSQNRRCGSFFTQGLTLRILFGTWKGRS